MTTLMTAECMGKCQSVWGALVFVLVVLLVFAVIPLIVVSRTK